jgi:hypothetical protein
MNARPLHSSARLLLVVRVERASVHGVHALEAEQRLRHIRFRVEYRALLLEQLHDECISRCGLTDEAGQSERRVDAGEVDAVLQRDRQTVQSTERTTARRQT